jgi:beta-glucosidase-like glycosyl hydrolase/CubicO group peptidase (beta-lactamase class C family)
MRLRIFLILTLLIFSNLINSAKAQQKDPPFLKFINHPWVDSVMKNLSPEERIAQLVWVAGFASRDISYDVELSNMIRDNKLGGIIFFKGYAPEQSEMINYFRTISRVPPIIALDGEWGIGMRLEDVIKFPYQLTLGAIKNDSLIYRMGSAIASQFKRAGVNINLAPVADVDNNPENPVINFRSFGEDPQNVARKTLMYMNGLQDNGIIAAAKHFPGHGDTEVDSHLDLPVINHKKERLDSVELFPFKALIDNGISGVMPGHLWVPAIEPANNVPSTISFNVLTGLLKNELSFKGLVLSDAMNMGGITKYAEKGEAEILAIKAGMDVLEYVTDPSMAIRNISDQVKKGEISQQSIDEKCRKVLAAKYWAGLSNPQPIVTENIIKELSSVNIETLIRELYASALTLINNENGIIPVKHLDSLKIATLAINRGSVTGYQSRLEKYAPVSHFFIDTLNSANTGKLLEKLSPYDLIIAGVFGTDQKASFNFGIPDGLNDFLEKLNAEKRCIITYFGNPYAVARLEGIQKSEGLLIAYQENEFTEDLSAQLIFGGTGAKGSLPVTINSKYPAGYGIITPGGLRLQYGPPESAGLNSSFLNRKIDSIAWQGINAGAYPGCEIMVARKGIVIFRKTYGYQTYDNRISVAEDDLFDLASVSKITGPLPGLMKLNEEGRFSPEKSLGYYLPYFRNSDKSDLPLKDILAHQAGLVSWIPFWKEAVNKKGKFKPKTFSHEYSEKYPLKVAENLFIHKDYRDKIFKEMKKSKLSGEKKYLYSDLAFIISPEIISSITGEKWYDYVTSNIYHKLGAYDIGFNPYLRYPLSRIVPTEYDSLFRKQQLHGTVHDEGAAMLGGISGHAGLFATANDLMKIMEMYRRMGSYGGEQIISDTILKMYTSYQFPENNNRRGLGFDKPQVDIGQPDLVRPYPTRSATPESFGHSGYTGTFVWIDPEKEFTYIFLCNRVYPTRNNNKLSDMNIRTEILQIIYDAINSNPEKN